MLHHDSAPIASLLPLCALAALLSCGEPSHDAPDQTLYVHTQAMKSAEDFVTTWDTSRSNNPMLTSQITLEITGSYEVDWDDDGIFEDMTMTGVSSYNYGTPGMRTVRVRSSTPLQFGFSNDAQATKLISVQQWGNIKWSSMQGMFRRCRNLTSLPLPPAAPDTSLVTNMSQMFEQARNFNQDIGHWDTSMVMDMSRMFQDAVAFNQPLSSWNTSQVTNMSQMFEQATSFDQDLGTWDISQVNDMSRMLDDSGMSTLNYDNTLIEWSKRTVTRSVTLGAASLTYCVSESERDRLVSMYQWSIEGDVMCAIDSDGDGISDDEEGFLELNPNNVDSDNDGICDGAIVVTGCSTAGPDPTNGVVCVTNRTCDLKLGDTCTFDDSCTSRSCQQGTCVCSMDSDCAMGEKCDSNNSPPECYTDSICGNAIVEMGERCDEGANNGQGMCDVNCMFVTPADMDSMNDMGDDMSSAVDMAPGSDDMGEDGTDMAANARDMSGSDDMQTQTGRPDVRSCATAPRPAPSSPAPLMLGLVGVLAGWRRARRESA